NTRSNGDIWQQNTFALVQSQCVYGTGMAWLFYNILPESYRRSAILSIEREILTQASIQEDMLCAGSWTKNLFDRSYQFTLIYRPDFPQAIYTLRLPLGEPAPGNYSQAILYEGAVEVLSPGLESNLRPTRGHLLSHDELTHNRFQLNYRMSLGDCDNHIRGCELSEQHHLINSMDWGRISMYCKYSLDLDGSQCITNSNMGRCTYNDDIRGNWVRISHPDGPHLGQVSIGFDVLGALMRLQGWGDAKFPATDFVCRKNFLLLSTTVPEGVYVMSKVADRMCATTQSCMQVLPAGRGSISADGRLQSLKNVIFMRISHDTTLSENEVPNSCSFKEKLIEQVVNRRSRLVAASYFYTLIAENVVQEAGVAANRGRFFAQK
uniref:G_PROTEIN_RECEP_F2_3 domain-containing protein n=2 Tax=Macrostomum lignano TaxID=282301 RepID=A0A1I8IG87_9PLAT